MNTFERSKTRHIEKPKVTTITTNSESKCHHKRLFYEDINVLEYWIVDVKKAELIAFAIGDGGSKRITSSEVLPGLAMFVLKEALRRSRSTDRGQVFSWLLTEFQQQ